MLVQHESGNIRLMEPVTPATLSQRDTSLIILTPHKRLTLRGEIMAKAVFSAVSSRNFKSVTAPLANATFVAFRDPDGVNPDGVVWEKVDSHWECVAWDGDSYGPSDVDDMELELLTAVADGVMEFYFGSDCSREEFFSYVFGHEAESDGAYGSDYDYPAHMAEPASMFARDGWHFYEFTLDPEKVEAQERELHEALDRLDETVHEEMYGSSYRV